MSFNCAATFTLPPPIPFIGCGENTSGVIISLSPNVYWNLSTDTGDHPFTNSMGFILSVGDVICLDGSGDVISFTPCIIKSQFLIDGTPITNPFPACPAGGLTPNLATYLFNTYKIDPSATITITDTVDNRIIVITTEGDLHLIATLQVLLEDIPFFFFDTPFVCTERRRRRRRIDGFRPYIYIPINDLPQLGKWNIVCNSSGTGQVCCYAWAGSIVGHVQCVGGVTNPLRFQSHLIQSAIAEAQAKSPTPIIAPIPVGNMMYQYDGIENNFYRFRSPITPPSLL